MAAWTVASSEMYSVAYLALKMVVPMVDLKEKPMVATMGH